MAGSIGDVAGLAGVSRTTVSHVISGNRPVSDAVSARVRQAMAELGYVPSRTAQNLVHGKTRTIGLLVPDIGNGFFADVAKGVEQTAIERGFNMVLCNTGWNLERELFYLETLKSHAVDGVVYAAGALAEESELNTLFSDMPVVAVDEELGAIPSSTVVSDNVVGGRLAAEHLLGLGHVGALVAGVNERLASGMQRVAGFCDTWRDRTGVEPTIAAGTFEEECGYRIARAQRASIASGEITAIFALNDLVALGALRGFAEAGLDVPRDCSIVGFDDIYTASHARPPLTTVRQDAVGLGSVASASLLDVLAGNPAVPRHVLDVELVARQTTAEPHGAAGHQGSRAARPQPVIAKEVPPVRRARQRREDSRRAPTTR